VLGRKQEWVQGAALLAEMTRKNKLFFLAAAGAVVWSYSQRVWRRWENVDLADIEKPGRLLQVGDIRLHYEEAGEGPPLLLLHGLNGSTFSFHLLSPLMKSRFRVIALDLLGFGYSDRPNGVDYSLEAQARLVAGFLDALSIEKTHLLGYSLGGAVAMHFAAAYPERVDRLILAASATDEEMRRGLRSSRVVRPLLPVVAVLTLHNKRFRRMSLRSACYDSSIITDELVEQYIAPSHVRGHLRALGSLMVDRGHDVRVDLSAVRAPTLVLWGAGDRWLPPSQGERLRELLPDARLVLVDRAGHLLFEERPEEAAKAITDFLTEPGRRGETQTLQVG